MAKELSEIAKLTERITKDPKSKLFVPLAEEYKKAGDIEMAILVLSDGLKHNPGYVTARSFLGRLLFDKGDYEGSRREFEEVIKAIPDNLLAHRKLGDLCLLQNDRTQGLVHYRSAAKLNPGDEELAALIADVEAGVDVRPRLTQQKQKAPADSGQQREKAAPVPRTASTPEQKTAPSAAAKVQPTAPVSSAKTATASAPQEPPQPVMQKTVKPVAPEPAPLPVPEAEPAPKVSTVFDSPQMRVQETIEAAGDLLAQEEPEDIVLVEPIEEEAAVASAAVFDASAAEPAVEMQTLPVQEEALSAGPVAQEEGLFAQEESAPAAEPAPAQETAWEEAAGEIASPARSAELEPTEAPEAPVASEETGDASDEFTTDTLAELYIAQGFYEKAIDIYERMVADHPGSKGLRDKLDRVRAMATASGAVAEESTLISLKEEAPAAVLETPQEPVIPAAEDTALFVAEPPVEEQVERVQAEAQEYVPPAAEANLGVFGEAEVTSAGGAAPPSEEEITIDAVEVQAEQADVLDAIAAVAAEPANEQAHEEEMTVDAELLAEPMAEVEEAPVPLAETEAALLPDLAEPEPLVTAEPSSASAFDIFASTATPAPEKKKQVPPDFVPREYVPPATSLAGVSRESGLPGPAQRKETIDRLENWLKNIMKER